MRGSLSAAATAALVLTGCDDRSSAGRSAPATEPAPSECDAADRQVTAGPSTRVCVWIGRSSLVRLAKPPSGEGSAQAVVCNTSDVKGAWIAWSRPQDPATATAEHLWEGADKGRRLALGPGECSRPLGPTGAVVLRGWRNGGQGFDVGTDWEATVTFRTGREGAGR